MRVVFAPEVEEDLYGLIKYLLRRSIWVLILLLFLM